MIRALILTVLLCPQTSAQVVQLRCEGDSGAQMLFSGVVVKANDKGSEIITVCHGIEGDGKIEVKAGGGWERARVVRALWRWDLARLRTSHEFDNPQKIGESDKDDNVSIKGWSYPDSGSSTVTKWGTIEKTKGGWLFATCTPDDGMSGGGVFKGGKLVGIVSANSGGKCKAVSFVKIRKVMK